MIVMKFGGSSVGTRERLAQVAALVRDEARPKVVVVSAMGDTTNQLLAAGAAAERGASDEVARWLERVGSTALGATDDPRCEAEARLLLAELAGLVEGIRLLGEQTPRSRALLASFGERLAVGVLASWLRREGLDAAPVDARGFVRTDDRFEEARVDLPATRARCRATLLPLLQAGVVPVVTGFLGSTAAGHTTVLGRSGSDYTASLVAASLDAHEVEIWTDVDGILTADPRKVREARTLRAVSYREAAEMSYFGAQVIHPKTMAPVIAPRIPIRVRSTLLPKRPGTLIGPTGDAERHGVKTVSSVDGLSLLTVEGSGMAGMVGTAQRIFAATERAGVNVMMISQASSEQSVSIVVRHAEADALVRELDAAFALEQRAGLVAPIGRDDAIGVVSIVGEEMAGRTGTSARLFGALGQLGVNVRAIAQAASELSISVAVPSDALDRAVRAVHTAFGLTRIVHVALIGVGQVGRTLLAQLAALAPGDVELRISLVASSRRWVLDPDGLAPDEVEARLEAGEERPSDEALIAALAARRFTETVVVDVTAADTTPLQLAALRAGFHVVSANKLPLAGPLAGYRALVRARDAAGVGYGYETTFGAGLPVLHTLKELVGTGDAILSIEGCFSGTLGFLTSRLDDGVGLSEAVAEARERGFTEPDPREDLAGRDVARKALIIARALGRQVELDEVQLEPLVAGLHAGLDAALAEAEGPLAARVAAARARGEVLRYVARVGEQVEVGLREVPQGSAIGSLRGADNILVFTTRRYAETPLVVRGPGAGAEVTAAGVLGDLLKIARGGAWTAGRIVG